MKDFTGLVKKYQDQKQFPRMIGTGGGMDYLIVARNPDKGVQLGIKPLFGAGSTENGPAIIVGFRLRAARIPGANVAQMEGEAAASVDPWDVWDFPWEKCGMSNTGIRASLIRSMALSRSPEDARWLFDDLDHVRFFGKVQQFLADHVPEEQFVVTTDDAADYFRASFYAPILAMQSQTDPKAALELLDHQWETQVKNHEKYQEMYEQKRKELLAQIEAAETGEAPQYVPKAHFSDELESESGVAKAMLSGAKPKLSVVGGTEGAGSDEDQSEEPEESSGPTFESHDGDETDQAEAAGDGSGETAA